MDNESQRSREMKSQVLGMLAAAAIGLATSAHAHNIAIGNIIPPGGNAQQASLIHAVDPTLFATPSTADRSWSSRWTPRRERRSS
jgi:hypothetical protein